MKQLLSLLLVAGCGLTNQAGAEDVAGEWTLQRLGATALIENVTLTIDADAGRVSGRAPCNGYSASLDAPLPGFQTGTILSTKRACPALALEQQFFATLSAISSAAIEDGILVLSDTDGPRLHFKRAE